MSKQHHSGCGDPVAIRQTRNQLERLPISNKTREKIDKYLKEASEACIDYISYDIRDLYCHAQKLAILQPYMIDPIREKAVKMFIIHNSALNTELEKYFSPESADNRITNTT